MFIECDNKGAYMNRNRKMMMDETLPKTPVFPDTTQIMDEKIDSLVVQIKSLYNNKYVEIGLDEFFYAITENPMTAKIFSLIILEDNNVMIRLHGARFLRVDQNGNLTVDLFNQGAAIFKLQEVDESSYAILAPNGSFIGVRDSDSRLVANQSNPNSSTVFKFRKVYHY
ncbi:hypothetical protein CHL78_011115 [Romboutsia weinsteinii]|uniref:Fascin-like domain-containing protein n=2 Tax=Romboutsia weinsteinii TaxID=2020949 RepID=A0A371J2H8_9FIRM|nr:hypothetical protein CHL78_011115 [Romboutsia weinsteinii]